MKTKTLLLLLLAFLVICSLPQTAVAQAVEATVKSQPDAPLQITRAACSSVEGKGFSCKASVQIPQTGRWTAFGLKWKLTLEDGKTTTFYEWGDASLRPGPYPGSFAPGELLERRDAGGFGMLGAAKQPSISSAEVELEFAMPAVGQTWGDTKSKNYSRLMSLRSGQDLAMNYLRSIYKKEGAEGVLKALGVVK